ncbi:MAG: PhzF family phenazine biosynthesis protein [Chthoniobacterales bacterium]
MPSLTFHTLDVFTDTVFGGNQLAVFPDAPDLPTAVMQSIAREFNLSETVFVRPSQHAGALRALRIFTPHSELPFAGHPTIGTAQLLVELGIAETSPDGTATFAVEEGVGLIPVEVARTAAGGFFSWLTAAREPEHRSDVPGREVLAAILGLRGDEIMDDEHDSPLACSAGVPYLCLPVCDRAALGRAEVDLARWRAALADSWAKELFVFCYEEGEINVRARMFAPGIGIVEDPATGSAVAAFAGYLWRREPKPGHWIIAQGVEMGRPSTLHLEIRGEHGKMEAVRVGGSAVRVSSGTLQLPD